LGLTYVHLLLNAINAATAATTTTITTIPITSAVLIIGLVTVTVVAVVVVDTEVLVIVLVTVVVEATLKLSIILDYCSRALKKRKYPFQDTKLFNLPCQVRREEGEKMREKFDFKCWV